MLKDNIKRYRKQNDNMSQRALADASGVSYSTITKLEAGNLTNPSEDILAKIADALNCSIQNLRYEETNDKYVRYEFDSNKWMLVSNGEKFVICRKDKCVIDVTYID